MEWAIGIPILLLVLVCPLMMVGMIVGGWVMGRRAVDGGGHGGHGMMMCHGGHGGGDTRHETGDTEPRADIVEEMKAERGRLDELIARAERGEAG